MSEQGTVSRLFFKTVGLTLVACESIAYVDIVDLERVQRYLTAIAAGRLSAPASGPFSGAPQPAGSLS